MMQKRFPSLNPPSGYYNKEARKNIAPIYTQYIGKKLWESLHSPRPTTASTSLPRPYSAWIRFSWPIDKRTLLAIINK